MALAARAVAAATPRDAPLVDASRPSRIDMESDSTRLVLPRQYSQRILRRSFNTVFCSSVAIMSARADYAVIAIGTMLTSINYWRRPIRGGAARAIDMTYVAASFAYQCWRAPLELSGRRHAAYWALAAVTISCYVRARSFGKQGDLDASSRWHSRIHLFGNVANAILYADVHAAFSAIRLGMCCVSWLVFAGLYARHCL